MSKVVTSQMLLNAQAEVKSLEQDGAFLKSKEKELATQTDEEIMERLKDRFEILEEMTRAVKKSDVRADRILTGKSELFKRNALRTVRQMIK